MPTEQIEFLLNRQLMSTNPSFELWDKAFTFRRLLLGHDATLTAEDVYDSVEKVCKAANVNFAKFYSYLEYAFETAKTPDIFGLALSLTYQSNWAPPGRLPDESKFIIRYLREFARVCEPFYFWISAKDLARVTCQDKDLCKNLIRSCKTKGWVTVIDEHKAWELCAHLRWNLDFDPDRVTIDDAPEWLKAKTSKKSKKKSKENSSEKDSDDSAETPDQNHPDNYNNLRSTSSYPSKWDDDNEDVPF